MWYKEWFFLSAVPDIINTSGTFSLSYLNNLVGKFALGHFCFVDKPCGMHTLILSFPKSWLLNLLFYLSSYFLAAALFSKFYWWWYVWCSTMTLTMFFSFDFKFYNSLLLCSVPWLLYNVREVFNTKWEDYWW